MTEELNKLLEQTYDNRLHIECRSTDYYPSLREVALLAMKDFARIMCEKQKEICADNAKADYQMITGTIVPDIEVYVLKQSILQCKNATEI